MTMRRMCSWLLPIWLAACVRDRPTTPEPPASVLVVLVAPAIESSTDFSGVDLEATIVASLEVDSSLEVESIGALPESDCGERVSCLRDVGRDRGAAFIATCTVVTLGDTAVLRMRMVPIDEAGTEQVRQAVLESATPDSVRASIAAMARELAAPFTIARAPERTRSRRFRWLGPLIGVAAAGAVAGTIAIVRTRDPDPDVVITPP